MNEFPQSRPEHPPPPGDTSHGPSRRAPMSKAQVTASVTAAILLTLLGLDTLREFVPALVWAVIFAIAIWPLFQRARRRWPRHADGHLLPILFTLVVALVFILPLALVFVPLAADAHDVVQWIDTARKTGVPPPAFLNHLPFGSKLVPLWQQDLGDPRHASSLFGRIAHGGALSMSSHVGSQVLHRLVLFGFTLLTLFFLFKEGETLGHQMITASRRAFGPAGERVGRQVIASVHGTVDGLVFVGLGEGVLLGIVYLLTGVPRPALFGLFTAALAMIPFGAAIAFCAAAALLLVGGSLVKAVIVVVAGTLTTFVADHFIRPTLIGGATRLPFLWVLFGILGGVEQFGLLGLFVGPAVMAVLILLWREWVGEEEGPINP